MCNATASHHRMGYLRVSHSAGIHRVDFGDTKETRIIFSSCWVGVKSQPIGCTHSLMVKQIDDGSNPSVCSRLKSSGYQTLVGELRHRNVWNVSHSATKILS